MENQDILDSNAGQSTGTVTDKTPGILAYCTLIGFIIAIVLNGSKTGEDKKFGAFHLRQALGLFLTMIAGIIGMMILGFILGLISYWIAGIVGGLLYFTIVIGGLVFLIMQIIAASQGQYKEVPLVGKTISKMFGSTFE